MILVGDIQGCEHGKANGVDRVRGLGHGAHLRVNVLGEFEDVLRIGAAQVVGLVKNLYPHAGVLRVTYRLILRSSCHKSFLVETKLAASRPVQPRASWPRRSTRSAPASSQLARG